MNIHSHIGHEVQSSFQWFAVPKWEGREDEL